MPVWCYGYYERAAARVQMAAAVAPSAAASGVKRARTEEETTETEDGYRRRLTRVLTTMQRPALVDILVSM